MPRIKVTLVRSTIGAPGVQRRTVEGLGLRRLNQSVVHNANLQILGMVRKVTHLVRVEEVTEEAEAK